MIFFGQKMCMYDKQFSYEFKYVLQNLSMEVRYGSQIFVHIVTHVWLFWTKFTTEKGWFTW